MVVLCVVILMLRRMLHDAQDMLSGGLTYLKTAWDVWGGLTIFSLS